MAKVLEQLRTIEVEMGDAIQDVEAESEAEEEPKPKKEKKVSLVSLSSNVGSCIWLAQKKRKSEAMAEIDATAEGIQEEGKKLKKKKSKKALAGDDVRFYRMSALYKLTVVSISYRSPLFKIHLLRLYLPLPQ